MLGPVERRWPSSARSRGRQRRHRGQRRAPADGLGRAPSSPPASCPLGARAPGVANWRSCAASPAQRSLPEAHPRSGPDSWAALAAQGRRRRAGQGESRARRVAARSVRRDRRPRRPPERRRRLPALGRAGRHRRRWRRTALRAAAPGERPMASRWKRRRDRSRGCPRYRRRPTGRAPSHPAAPGRAPRREPRPAPPQRRRARPRRGPLASGAKRPRPAAGPRSVARCGRRDSRDETAAVRDPPALAGARSATPSLPPSGCHLLGHADLASRRALPQLSGSVTQRNALAPAAVFGRERDAAHLVGDEEDVELARGRSSTGRRWRSAPRRERAAPP